MGKENKNNANVVGAGLAFGKNEELIVNSEEYKCYASGITLIALIITIIIMLILAGVVLSLTIGEHGIFKTAKNASLAYEENGAREKLEVVLFDMQTEKILNTEYNQNEYLNKKIEENGMKIEGDIVDVDGWKFTIDRSVPKIGESIGKGELNQQIKLVLSQTVSNDYVKSTIKIEIEYEGEITLVKVGETILEVPEKKDGKYIIQHEVTSTGNYNVLVKDTEEKYQIGSIKVTEVTDDMDIHIAEDLIAFRDRINKGATYEGKTVRLVNDIDLSTICSEELGNWEPIGNNTHPFKGTFDGQNHTIKNLYIEIRSQNNRGLFGYNHGAIKNIVVDGCVKSSESYTGMLVGYNVGNIENVTTYGTVWGWNYTGGITGYNIGNIEKCTNNAEVAYKIGSGGNYGKYVGGIAGGSNKGKIEKCINNGNITGNLYVAGILGLQQLGASTNLCINHGTIIGNRDSISSSSNVVRAGGIVGGLCYYATEKITNCYNTGDITTNAGGSLGGIVAWVEFRDYSMIENCYNVGHVTGGGIMDIFNGSSSGCLSNNYWLDSCGSSYGIKQGQTNDNAEPKSEEEFNNLAEALGEEYENDVQVTLKDETGLEKQGWKYNNGYPILKWQLEK